MNLNDKAKKLLEPSETDGSEYSPIGFGEFGDYFKNKAIKQQNQASEAATVKTSIFKGCIVYVNGYTKPPLIEIKQLVLENGGIFIHYLGGKTFCTHIVCSNLTTRKAADYAKYRIVKPEWVVDSVAKGHIVPWANYRVTAQGVKSPSKLKFKIKQPPRERLADAENEASGASDNASQNDNSTYSTVQRLSDSESQTTSSNNNAISPSRESGPDPYTTNVPEPNAQNEEDILDDSAPALVEAETNTQENVDDSQDFVNEQQHDLDINKQPKNLLTLHTLHPDFIETFYSNSRLHHLSTWKSDLKFKFQKAASEINKTNTSPDVQRRQKVIMHVDFDSFFVSVSLLKRSDLERKPVCVSASSSGNAEIASCNYIARQFGVKNGMWMTRARKLCPELEVLPYDFAAYERASNCLFEVLVDLKPLALFPVSIDEALVDVTNLVQSPSEIQDLMISIRHRVMASALIDVSVGAGCNVLMAKLALRKAKPNGQFYVKPEDNIALLDQTPINSLPGIGNNIAGKLAENHCDKIATIRAKGAFEVGQWVGTKTGEKLFQYSNGEDDTPIDQIPPPKNVGIEISWGIRLKNNHEVAEFIHNMSSELSKRLKKHNVKGSQLVVKIYQRRSDAPIDPPKFLGHGLCDIHSKTSLITHTNETAVIAATARGVVRGMNCPPLDLRGLGLQMRLGESDGQQDVLNMKSKPGPGTTLTGKMPARKEELLDTKKRRWEETAPSSTRTAADEIFKKRQRATFDRRILDELPEDIRKEVIEEFNITQSQEKSQKKKTWEPKHQVFELFGQTTMPAIKTTVQDWIFESALCGPNKKDVSSLLMYIRKTVARGNPMLCLDLQRWMDFLLSSIDSVHDDWRMLQARLNEVMDRL